MKFDRSKPHNHGPMKCRTCKEVRQECVCLPKGRKTEWTDCPSCRSKKAQESMQRTYDLNQKLKALGILAPTPKEGDKDGSR